MCVCTVFYGAGGGGKLSAGLKWAVDHAEDPCSIYHKNPRISSSPYVYTIQSFYTTTSGRLNDCNQPSLYLSFAPCSDK